MVNPRPYFCLSEKINRPSGTGPLFSYFQALRARLLSFGPSGTGYTLTLRSADVPTDRLNPTQKSESLCPLCLCGESHPLRPLTRLYGKTNQEKESERECNFNKDRPGRFDFCILPFYFCLYRATLVPSRLALGIDPDSVSHPGLYADLARGIYLG